MNPPKPGAALLHTITDIIQHAIDKGEHANPADFAHVVLAAVEDHYAARREGLFKKGYLEIRT
jgi:hypothetical protein